MASSSPVERGFDKNVENGFDKNKVPAHLLNVARHLIECEIPESVFWWVIWKEDCRCEEEFGFLTDIFEWVEVDKPRPENYSICHRCVDEASTVTYCNCYNSTYKRWEEILNNYVKDAIAAYEFEQSREVVMSE